MASDAGSPRSLRRILGLFDTIAKASDGLSLAELSIMLESPKSSLLMLLRQMVDMNYLVHEGDRYRLGSAIFRLASDILSMRQFPKLIRPYMEELAARSQESVYLAILDADAQLVTYVEGIESTQEVRYSVTTGTTRPLYCTAAGRCLLAFQEPAWIERYSKSVKFQPVTAGTLVNRVALIEELEKIRDDGTAISMGEVVKDAAGIAAPVFERPGKVAAAILIAAPANRFERELPELQKMIREVTERASGMLVQVPHRL